MSWLVGATPSAGQPKDAGQTAITESVQFKVDEDQFAAAASLPQAASQSRDSDSQVDQAPDGSQLICERAQRRQEGDEKQ